MASITLKPFSHKSKNCIAIKFTYNFEIKEYIKKFNGVYWSKTHATFYIYYDKVRLEAIKNYIKKGGLFLLEKNSKTLVSNSNYNKNNKTKLFPLSDEKTIVYQHFLNFLKGKRFSNSTITSYGNFVLDFLCFTKQKPVNDLNENDVRLYIEWTVNKLNYAISTHRQMVSALTHFAYFYPACAIDIDKIYMPRKDKKLPIVLSIEEVLSLLQSTKNLKHRAIIAILYSSGLRIGELIDLKLHDFDFKRKQLYIKNAKGRKDRYTTIAESVFPLLKDYYKSYKPKVFFIENPKGGQYSPESIRAFLRRNTKMAGIEKNVTPHTLRHSYATHMLEQGIDIRYIQELLGHSRPETTMIYTHVTRKDLQKIKSPLDNAIKKLSLQNNSNKKLFIP